MNRKVGTCTAFSRFTVLFKPKTLGICPQTQETACCRGLYQHCPGERMFESRNGTSIAKPFICFWLNLQRVLIMLDLELHVFVGTLWHMNRLVLATMEQTYSAFCSSMRYLRFTMIWSNPINQSYIIHMHP